jgi:tRNA(fMet)-specific endonuclease VapC
MAYLIDTDVTIDLLNGREPARRLFNRIADARFAASIVTVAELYDGAFRSTNPSARVIEIRSYLASWTILPVSDPVALLFGELRVYLRQRGELIADFDLLIASTALNHDLTLITFNKRHFDRIPDLRLYSGQ